MEARKVEPGNGLLWIKQGMDLYLKSPLLWTAMTVATVLGLVAIASIPVVGDPLATLLFPVLLAGFMLGCRALHRGDELEFGHLFTGFRHNTHQLIALGGINFAAQMLIMGLVKLTGGEKLVELMMSTEMEDPNVFAQAVQDAGISIIIGMALYSVLVMAMQFAPALVLFRHAAPLQALKASLKACLANILPLSVYAGIMLLLGLVATFLTLMLGWLVLLPLMFATTYVAYGDLFPPELEPRDDSQENS